MMKSNNLYAVLVLLLSLCLAETSMAQFRVKPYLLPADTVFNYRLIWFSEKAQPGILKVWEQTVADTLTWSTDPIYMHELTYSELEEKQRDDYPDMFSGGNWRHSVYLASLIPDKRYQYEVVQGSETWSGTFRTAPQKGARQAVRFVAFADSETDPDGRVTYRPWPIGIQHSKSSGRPDRIKNYPLTETEGFIANLNEITKTSPDFVLLAGDIVQGGGYQRAWDEFFFHVAGRFGTPFSNFALLPALGNWENYGARNGEYEPNVIRQARTKYKSYFPLPSNNHVLYQDAYYRVDYGPVTIITLDSSNGLPDSTDFDTNIHISLDTYPGRDIPDINPGSDQWRWAEAQLKDAAESGQIIFVQFHHVPYSSGGHILPLTMEGSSGQAGVPMRQYTPMFKRYGVVAVLCGHNEALEHSEVDGVHFWDVGIAGDGLGAPNDDVDPRRKNEFSKWSAHKHAPEYWQGNRLLEGGKHYGHLQINVEPIGPKSYRITMTPFHIFPIVDDNGHVINIEKRMYHHVVSLQKYF